MGQHCGNSTGQPPTCPLMTVTATVTGPAATHVRDGCVTCPRSRGGSRGGSVEIPRKHVLNQFLTPLRQGHGRLRYMYQILALKLRLRFTRINTRIESIPSLVSGLTAPYEVAGMRTAPHTRKEKVCQPIREPSRSFMSLSRQTFHFFSFHLLLHPNTHTYSHT